MGGHCLLCHRAIWPWQRRGHYVLATGSLVRWHRRCALMQWTRPLAAMLADYGRRVATPDQLAWIGSLDRYNLTESDLE